MNLRGNLKLDIDELALAARITISPDPQGGEITQESIAALLREKGVREGLDTEGIEKAFRTLQRKPTEAVTFLAAQGKPPAPPEPEKVTFEPLAMPERLAAAARECFASTPVPQVFHERVEKVKTEKKVLKKQALPFLPAREEVEVAWEKKVIRELVKVDPAVRQHGYLEAGALVARVAPGRPGRDGRSILGRMVASARTAAGQVHFGEGLARARSEVRAERSGFLRRGDTWCDIVAFSDHRVGLTRSADGLTCMLSFEPGDPRAPPPDTAEILARAQALGFESSTLCPQDGVAAVLRKALAARQPLAAAPLSRPVDGFVKVTVAPDGLRATLTIQKGRGSGKAVSLTDIGAAVRGSGVRISKPEAVKKDILAFISGPKSRLEEHLLAEGRAAEPGTDGSLEWLLGFLPARAAAAVKERAVAAAPRLAGLKSLAELPLTAADAAVPVAAGTAVLKIGQAREGKPGIDARGKPIPAPRGSEAEVRLFEGLRREKDTVVTTAAGMLEKASNGMAVMLRVLPNRDGAFSVTVATDGMSAAVTHVPAEGIGAVVGHEQVQTALGKAGVVQGIDEQKLRDAMDAVRKNMPLAGLVVARGKKPAQPSDRVRVHVRVATGKSVAVRADGRADFRSQDKITLVVKDTHLATLAPSPGKLQDGWDVTGAVVPASEDERGFLAAGAGVRAVEQPDGSVQFFADCAGELAQLPGLIEVRQVHTVEKDVDLATGNVRFSGTVLVGGTVHPGFSVVAGGDIAVEDVVQAAFLSAGGSVRIGRGIKGMEKAVVRAKGSLETTFVEQAALVVGGDVRINGACLFCRITCNGRLVLESEKGSIMGGVVRASRGVEAQNIGSAGGASTLVSFGQDYVLLEKIEKEQREIAKLKARMTELDIAMRDLLRAGLRDEAALAAARAEKLTTMKSIEQRGLLLIGMKDRFDEHIASEVVIRGTLYPNVIVESHARRFSVQTEKTGLRLFFSKVEGKVMEKL